MRSRTSSAAVAGIALIAVAVVSAVPGARAALAPEQQCAKRRYDAKAKYDQCQAKALGKHFAVNDLAKLQPALSKCRVKYTSIWVKLQKKALGTGSTCDQNRFVLVTPFSTTVMDNLTGLEWEKKDDNGFMHDKDDTYALFNAVFNFLAGNFGDGLNHTSSDNCGLAAKCDWRLPTVAELQTILSEPFPCATSPCIDAIFGPTAATDHWSSTTLADNPDYAWGVFFGTGEVSYGVKILTNSVRAVRGGL